MLIEFKKYIYVIKFLEIHKNYPIHAFTIKFKNY